MLGTGSKAQAAYKKAEIRERHRHRYEFNNSYRKVFADNGMLFSGTSPDNELVEIIELANHPWFVAVQFHPEFRSTPVTPHPLFVDFIGHSISFRPKEAAPAKCRKETTSKRS